MASTRDLWPIDAARRRRYVASGLLCAYDNQPIGTRRDRRKTSERALDMAQSTLIKNGRVIDPTQEIDEITSVAIKDGRIAGIGDTLPSSADEVIDAKGLIVSPGLIDMHVHLREPGFEDSETIATGTASAVAGGFTAVACMPNTDPPLDNDSAIEFVLRQAARAESARVYPIGALTERRAGKELAEVGLMVRAGAIAFSDDGAGIGDAGVCLRAMRYVSMLDRLFIQHCEDPSLAGGCMNAGPTQVRLGLPGVSSTAEVVMIQRDITLAEQAGVRYHVAHVSTEAGVELIRGAKRGGRRVSAEVCPHHLLLTDEACVGYDPVFKVNPPLRSAKDVAACIRGVQDGTIDCIVSDHAPHKREDKEREFQFAPFGMIGLETTLPLAIQALIDPEVITWPRLIHALSTRPAQLLGVTGGTLNVGQPADVTLIDPDCAWVIDAEQMRSKSRNTPFDGRAVRGRAVGTIVGGQWRYRDEQRLGTN